MAATPYSISYSKGTTANLIEISGSLVINHIEKIHAELLRTIDLTKNLKITVCQAEAIDITFIQIILALKKQYKLSELELSVVFDLSDDTWNLLNNAGFTKQLIN
jgi:hypothetical protein